MRNWLSHITVWSCTTAGIALYRALPQPLSIDASVSTITRFSMWLASVCDGFCTHSLSWRSCHRFWCSSSRADTYRVYLLTMDRQALINAFKSWSSWDAPRWKCLSLLRACLPARDGAACLENIRREQCNGRRRINLIRQRRELFLRNWEHSKKKALK